jgi:hypothetical protein
MKKLKMIKTNQSINSYTVENTRLEKCTSMDLWIYQKWNPMLKR